MTSQMKMIFNEFYRQGLIIYDQAFRFHRHELTNLVSR